MTNFANKLCTTILLLSSSAQAQAATASLDPLNLRVQRIAGISHEQGYYPPARAQKTGRISYQSKCGILQTDKWKTPGYFINFWDTNGRNYSHYYQDCLNTFVAAVNVTLTPLEDECLAFTRNRIDNPVPEPYQSRLDAKLSPLNAAYSQCVQQITDIGLAYFPRYMTAAQTPWVKPTYVPPVIPPKPVPSRVITKNVNQEVCSVYSSSGNANPSAWTPNEVRVYVNAIYDQYTDKLGNVVTGSGVVAGTLKSTVDFGVSDTAISSPLAAACGNKAASLRIDSANQLVKGTEFCAPVVSCVTGVMDMGITNLKNFRACPEKMAPIVAMQENILKLQNDYRRGVPNISPLTILIQINAKTALIKKGCAN